MLDALARYDLRATEDEGRQVLRVAGRPGTHDFWLTTNITTLQEGVVGFECFLPVLVPHGRLDAVREVCLWLSAEGRVAFASTVVARWRDRRLRFGPSTRRPRPT